MSTHTLFTSESVAAGHPAKLCDRVSDTILDALLAKDPNARAAIETVAGADHIFLFGEVTSSANVNFTDVAKQTVRNLGYTQPAWGFSDNSPITSFIHKQSAHIALGTDNGGAGDQGMMFGYACQETPELMPLPITLAHELTRRLDQVRESGAIPFLRPDGKAQVTVRYENKQPIGVDAVVIATAHKEDVTPEEVRAQVIKHVITPVLEQYGYGVADKQIIINGTGIWHIPGPDTDAGLTGRKIVVDGYGGYARVGGGAFSGKDPSKVDRSGAYAARYIAKNIVAHKLAERCEVALAYIIGHPRPIMEQIDSFGTATVSQKALEDFAAKLIDTSVNGIIETLELRRPIYTATSSYGHFGRSDFSWEKVA
jgi:S-adenosylmethionine synthetase